MAATSEHNIRFMSDKMILADFVIEDAVRISEEQKHLRTKGTKFKWFDFACIYLACRLNNIPKTLDDVSSVCNIKKNDLAKGYNKIMIESNYKYKVDIQNPLIFLSQLVSRLGDAVSPKTVQDTRRALSENAKICTLVQKKPMSRVGSILWVYAEQNGDRITQRDIASCLTISEVAVRTNAVKYKSLMEKEEGC